MVLIGAVILLNNLGKSVPLWSLFWDYWPLLLIAIGVLGLVEVLYHVGRGETMPPRPLAGGWLFWIVVPLAFVGWASHSNHIVIQPLRAGGLSFLGSEYQYDVNAAGAAAGVARVVLDNLHGNLAVKGEDGADIKVTGRKIVRAFSRADADRANDQSSVRIDRQGDLLIIRSEEPRSVRTLALSTDLDITMPRGVEIEARGRSGDLSIDDISGMIDINNGAGDVRLTNIGRDVRIAASRSGLIRASAVNGPVDVEGRGSDVQIENITGPVSVNGEFSGTLEFRSLASPLHFQSQRSEFRVEKIPGSVTLDLSQLRIENAVGPVHFRSASRDIHVTDVTDSMDIDINHGDIEVVQDKTPLPKLDIHSQNGDLTLALPAKADFTLDATTRRGDVTNDWGDPLKTETEGHGRVIRGQIGNGPELRLLTNRGSVTVRKD
jgi:DUF4097 and DUF4098 domain-containing protein YvlB